MSSYTHEFVWFRSHAVADGEVSYVGSTQQQPAAPARPRGSRIFDVASSLLGSIKQPNCPRYDCIRRYVQ